MLFLTASDLLQGFRDHDEFWDPPIGLAMDEICDSVYHRKHQAPGLRKPLNSSLCGKIIVPQRSVLCRCRAIVPAPLATGSFAPLKRLLPTLPPTPHPVKGPQVALIAIHEHPGGVSSSTLPRLRLCPVTMIHKRSMWLRVLPPASARDLSKMECVTMVPASALKADTVLLLRVQMACASFN